MNSSYYHAGRVLGHLHMMFGDRLTAVAINNSVTLANRLPVVLRHVWPDAVRDGKFMELLGAEELPTVPPNGEQQGSVWLGYYHRKHDMRK